MAALTMAQAYAYARQAGFDPSAATIAAAIAMAESGLNPSATGDVDRETPYWGPSVGLMQIRTVKGDTGTGKDRDITKLRDPVQNMIAAYHISNGGKTWQPWTTYTSGKYRQFLGQASAPAAGGGSTTVTATQVGFGGDVASSFGLDKLAEKAHDWGIYALAGIVGCTLVILGGYKLAGSPKPPKTSALALL